MISIDLESRSATDLITDGAYNYASCPSTEIIVMCYSVDGGDVQTWHPGEPVPSHFNNCYPHRYYAFNAAFERLMWDYIMTPDHGFPVIALEQWRCSMFMSRTNNLPGALGNAARCLGIPDQKSQRGKALIKLLCVPMADGTFNKDPELLAEMDDYCVADVKAEMGVHGMLREPTDEEWSDYYANERINDRGVYIDRELCEAAQIYASEEEAELIGVIEEVTEGVVTKARGEKLKEWVVERLTKEQEKLLVKYRDGKKMLSLDKFNRSRLLALEELDPDVRDVVEASDFAQKSSVGKFKAMSRRADPVDLRVRGAFLCNGASQSGRFSSKGLQLHNFTRIVMDDPMEVRADFLDEIMAEDITDYFGMPIMTILSRMLRPALIPQPGNVFLVSDWSAIEGRVAPWLCDDVMGERKLDLYRNDEPVYEITAAATFRCAVEDVTKDQRQVGKVQELAFGFGGGKGAYMAMARNYGMSATDAEADRYKDAWRRVNPWAQKIWADIERASKLAVSNPTREYKVGRLTYVAFEGILCGGTTLFCILPDDRLLTYPDARIEQVETPWGEMRPALTALRAAFVPKATEKEWPRTNLWGGLLMENATQGTAASLLRYAVREAEFEGLQIVFHVHDELVVEAGERTHQNIKDELHGIMNTAPAWAPGLPLKADVDVMTRYGK